MVETLYEFFPKLYLSPKDTIGNTPLHYIPFDRNMTYGWLLQNGADANARNKEGDTPLHVFVAHKDSVVQADGHLSPNLLCIQKLLAHGVPLEGLNKKGMTPKDEAIDNENYTVAGLLDLEVCVQSLVLYPCRA
jgi:ankyrin repeat protein